MMVTTQCDTLEREKNMVGKTVRLRW